MKILILFLILLVTSQNCPFNFGTTNLEVLALAGVTNTGPTIVFGSVGVSAGSAVVGFPPGITTPTPMDVHNNDFYSGQGQTDALNLHNYVISQACTVNFAAPTDIGGMTLASGVYCFGSSAQITGTLTLNAQNNPNARWIFLITSTLTTASGASVVQINGGIPCQVVWDIGSSATMGSSTNFIGNIDALASITYVTGSNSVGRNWARTGSVTLDDNILTLPPNVNISSTTNCTITTHMQINTTTIVGNNVTIITNTTICNNCTFTNLTRVSYAYTCGSIITITSYLNTSLNPVCTNTTTYRRGEEELDDKILVVHVKIICETCTNSPRHHKKCWEYVNNTLVDNICFIRHEKSIELCPNEFDSRHGLIFGCDVNEIYEKHIDEINREREDKEKCKYFDDDFCRKEEKFKKDCDEFNGEECQWPFTLKNKYFRKCDENINDCFKRIHIKEERRCKSVCKRYPKEFRSDRDEDDEDSHRKKKKIFEYICERNDDDITPMFWILLLFGFIVVVIFFFIYFCFYYDYGKNMNGIINNPYEKVNIDITY